MSGVFSVIGLVLFSLCGCTVSTRQAICCVPDQLEGKFYLGYGMAFVDSNTGRAPNTASSYLNGTVTFAYDYTGSRSYMFVNGTQVSPLIPNPEPSVTTFINDFKTGMQYQIDGSGNCQKSSIGNMTKQCILSGGKEVVYGFLAAGSSYAANYEFDFPGDLAMKITAAVTRTGSDPDTCLPLHAVFSPANGHGGIMYSADFVDTSEGISDPGVFKPPPQCLNVQINDKPRDKSTDPMMKYLNGL